MDNKESTSAAQPYVRTRRSAAARAAAAAVQQAGASAGFAPAPQIVPEKAPAGQKRGAESALIAPVVYEPSGRELRAPSVKPIGFRDAGNGRAARSKGRFIFFAILLGIASGIFLSFLHEQNQLLSGTDIGSYGKVDMMIICVLCGGALGLICSLILSPIHKRLSSVLPLYALLLFLPVLLFLLMPLIIKGTQFIFALIGAAISILATVIALFLIWTSLCGG